jgi:lipopolysaccharide/colanic/teichoic acid biosynthesis glycosyltransferase
MHLKRLFDIFIAGTALILLSPVLVFIAIAIRWESKGPSFYRGLRIGRHGVPFRIFKFRSMVVNAEEVGGTSTSDEDSRVTKLGRFIRRYKLDELAQLINVLLGDMSMVGPRPEVQKFVDKYSDEEKIILLVRPGITDYASLKFHNEGEIIAASGIPDADEAYEKLIRPEKLRLQIKYVKERNFWVDLKLIFQTLFRVFLKR